MPIKADGFSVRCPKCGLPAQQVEAVIEERLYGDRFAGVITARIMTHVHQDGSKMTCRERVPDWIMTLANQAEIEKFRHNIAAFMPRWGGVSQAKVL